MYNIVLAIISKRPSVESDSVCQFTGVLKKFEEEDLDDLLRKRLKDSSELPGALWHIYANKDADKIKEFLQKVSLIHLYFIFELNSLFFRTNYNVCAQFLDNSR